MTKSKVAAITRTKDRPLFLARAIESVHAQTFSEFIHVIINDGGNSEAVEGEVSKLPEAWRSRIRIIHNPESRGMEAASNKAIKSLDSEYIAIHDDDDTWHPEFLAETVALCEEKKASGVVVRTDKITEEVHGVTIKRLKSLQWMPDVKVINLYRQCIDNQMTPITFLYRRSAYDELGGYDETLPVLGDWDFGIRFLQKHDVEYLDPGFALANYHHRKATGTTGDNSFGAGQEKHRYWSNKLMNKYLRQELAEGRLGAGYIMNKLRYDQHEKAELVRRLLPGFITKRLKRRIQN